MRARRYRPVAVGVVALAVLGACGPGRGGGGETSVSPSVQGDGSGPTVASRFAFQLGRPFPAAERARLLDAMAGRAAQA